MQQPSGNSDSPPPTVRSSDPPAPPRRTEHVFVLDDDTGILRLEQRALERAGYVVTISTNIQEGKQLVRSARPDLLVLDYNVGGTVSGLDFYRALRQQGTDVPAILVSAFTDEGRAIEALRAGVRDVIPKVGDYLDYLPEAVGRIVTQVRAARALAEAEASSRAKDRFLAILSHELRTPLTPVLTAVQMLQAARDLPAETRETLELIRRNVELEARLIDDLLDLTRISRGKMRLQPSTTDLHERLTNALQTVKDDIRGKQLTLNVEFAASRTSVLADPTRLQQVFWNLLKNAVKFTPEGGTVSVRTSDAGADRIRIDVADTGVGIAEASIGRIFNAFEQGGTDVTRQFGGLGLGLNISRALVEAHGGRISASSAGIGRGATFSVELPAKPAAPPSAAPAGAASDAAAPSSGAQTPGAPANPRVLLVEDHPDTAAMMARLLRRSGHLVTTADSVASALQIAGSQEFDVVVSDIGLPDGSGLDLMRQLLARHAMKGIALSGFGMDEDLVRSREAGFVEHLVKPVSLDQLESALKRVSAMNVELE